MMTLRPPNIGRGRYGQHSRAAFPAADVVHALTRGMCSPPDTDPDEHDLARVDLMPPEPGINDLLVAIDAHQSL
jgi:hypothetical protein